MTIKYKIELTSNTSAGWSYQVFAPNGVVVGNGYAGSKELAMAAAEHTAATHALRGGSTETYDFNPFQRDGVKDAADYLKYDDDYREQGHDDDGQR
jgi:hypothetical protein